MEDVTRFSTELFTNAMCIKDRTIRCNYAPAYAVSLSCVEFLRYVS